MNDLLVSEMIECGSRRVIYPTLKLRIISPNPGFLPYIKVYVLSSLAVSHNPPRMERTKTVRLTANCQPGIPVIPNRSITSTGAEKGKMLKTTEGVKLLNIKNIGSSSEFV